MHENETWVLLAASQQHGRYRAGQELRKTPKNSSAKEQTVVALGGPVMTTKLAILDYSSILLPTQVDQMYWKQKEEMRAARHMSGLLPFPKTETCLPVFTHSSCSHLPEYSSLKVPLPSFLAKSWQVTQVRFCRVKLLV